MTPSHRADTVYRMLTSVQGVSKPTIAFSTWKRKVSVAPYGTFDLESVGAEYISAIQAAGGRAILLPHSGPEDAPALLELADGLVLIGGEDLDPATYGEPNDGLSRRTDLDADAFELALAAGASRKGLPTLAICRGMQIVNVALGGSLHQDISASEVPHLDSDPEVSGLPVTHHRVQISDPSCRLSRLYGSEMTVNSIHHQALARIASDLIVVAAAEDGVVEGVESSSAEAWPLIGVQWHPEKATDSAPLFQWLVESAAEFRNRQTDLLENAF